MNSSQATENAYRQCLQQARNHYENFPVASLLIPARLRKFIAAIYAFARMADDIADEGNDPDDTRVQKLLDVKRQLDHAAQGQHDETYIFIAISDLLSHRPNLLPYLHKLIDAFVMDTKIKRYANFDEVMHYCEHSANPIGRMLLILFQREDDRLYQMSDKICTSLQVINFLQDVYQDLTIRDRIYIPASDMSQFDVNEHDLLNNSPANNINRLIQYQADRIEQMLMDGAQLPTQLSGRIALELRMVVLGGWTVLQKVRNRPHIQYQPRLSKKDWMWIVFHSLLPDFNKTVKKLVHQPS